MQAITYARTSTDDQRNGVASQRKRLKAAVTERGWRAKPITEHASAKTLARRPKLRAALDTLDQLGEDGALVVTSLDRLARSTRDFASILQRAEAAGWRLLVLDLGGDRLDTATPMGKAMARIVMVVAELESELISERTRRAMSELRDRGVQLGHPSTVTDATRARIAELRAEGLGLRPIAERLNREGVPAPSGKPGARWHHTSVLRHAT